ncbi:MAG TPA: acetylxylan esterase [Planctomycetaceae bacterium]|nr:acetylxylan esterase [Blastopirellula sp.]HAY80814.1 acetylxylan esterase [Planctomycetaceae bacterium]
MRTAYLTLILCVLLPQSSPAQGTATSRGDAMIAKYFERETNELSDTCLADVESLEQWQTQRERYRRELLEMLGLQPLPEKTALQVEITGTQEQDEFIVENLHFQSRPGLYVTANLYRPKVVRGKLPAVLYVCGHGAVKRNGVSFGNKVHYHHHGCWFARNGYLCLVIDTLQLGEIEGIHHGTYRYNRWWWLNRSYTPAGVEAWNCVRAIDYLQSRPEVDGERIGVTGRSGGGAYSWWIAAIDDRIKCAVPVAGITDLQNHVVDGTVEGHCDCMFMVNTFRWDYTKVAALVAPRPLLISNTDSDRIFPLDGVYRTFKQVRDIYGLYNASDKVALNITAGSHKDTQELRVHAFRWLNFHLKGDDSLITKTAEKHLEAETLRVFDRLPEDENNTQIDETFVATANRLPLPQNAQELEGQRNTIKRTLQEKCFRGWPQETTHLDAKLAFDSTADNIRMRAFDFTSQTGIRLRLYLAERANLTKPDLVVLNVMDQTEWQRFLATYRPAFERELQQETLPAADGESFERTTKMFRAFKWTMAYVAPRGVGPTQWNTDQRNQIQIRRRFHLLGQTLQGMQTYDVRRAIQMLRTVEGRETQPLWLQSHRQMAGVTLYASLFEPQIKRLDLHALPATHRDGPFFLNIRRVVDLPETVALAAHKSQLVLYGDHQEAWEYPQQVARQVGWPNQQFQLRKPPAP